MRLARHRRGLQDHWLVIPLVGIAACLCALAVSLGGDGGFNVFGSYSLGFTGLCLLMAAASFAPARVMTLWGAIYVPLSGLWLAPALDAGFELVGGFVLLGVIGAVLYGATTAVVLTLCLVRSGTHAGE